MQAPGEVPLPKAATAAADADAEAPAPKRAAPATSWVVEEPAKAPAADTPVWNRPQPAPNAAPAAPVPSAAAPLPGALDLGAGITALPGADAPAPPMAGDGGVVAPGAGPVAGGGELPGMYVASPANALSTNDLMLKMSLGNTKEQLVPAANIVRAILSNFTVTPIDK